MSAGQHNDRRSCCPHDVKRDDKNMREGTMVLLYRLGLLLVGERTSGSSFWVAGLLSCTVGSMGGKGNNSSKAHLGEGERRSTVRGRERRVLTVEDYDIKLRIIRRLNLLTPTFSIYMCRAIYNSKGVNYNTRVWLYFLYGMPIIFPI